MASAVLSRQNDNYWGEKMYMRKAPSTPSPNVLVSPNPSHSPASHASSHNRNEVHAALLDDAHPVSRSAGTTVSESSYTFSHRREDYHRGGLVAYNMGSLSRPELRKLKRRLVSELEQVRAVGDRIESHLSRIYGEGGGAVADLASGSDPDSNKLLASMMKQCAQMLSKLMKQKGSVWFNAPVDVVGMGLHDYYQIIQNPMDLGTVKSKLSKSQYSSPMHFASDVRLTFNNALLYNPEGHEVHKLAGRLLRLFEGYFSLAYEKYDLQIREMLRQNGSAAGPASLVRQATDNPTVARSIPPQPSLQLPHQGQKQHNVGKVLPGKQPKPKARDPNKRVMTFEEKQRLSIELQSLPAEKMDQVVNILRRRNGDPAQHGDEIELDFETMDNETLWELDRFVGNCKKTMNKIKRQEALNNGNKSAASSCFISDPGCDKISPLLQSSQTPEAEWVLAAKKLKRRDVVLVGEEDVDIGDELPPTHYPPVEIDRDVGGSSSSSGSSSSDSSSDSDTESGSSESDTAAHHPAGS